MTLLKKVSQPIETANGLPNPLYTDPAVYARPSRGECDVTRQDESYQDI